MLILLLAGLTGVPLLQASEHPTKGKAAEAFKGKFSQLCQTAHVVGASALLVDREKDAIFECYGQSNTVGHVPVDRNTAFHWASITKAFTSVGILQLRDRGLLSLEDPITKYIPELRRVHNPFGSMDAITLRQLMTHTSGFQDPTWPWKAGKPWEPFEPAEWSQLVAMFPYMEIQFQPGSKYGYSNPGFIFLARVIEILTGDPFVSYAEKNILRPLGMSESYFDRAPYHLTSRRSHSYLLPSGAEAMRELPFDFNTGITVGNGGLNGPLTDMAKFVRFILGEKVGPKSFEILSQASLQELRRTDFQIGKAYLRGVALYGYEEKGLHWIEHTGLQNGFSSVISIAPSKGIGMILAFNTFMEPDPFKLAPDGALATPPTSKVWDALFECVGASPERPGKE